MAAGDATAAARAPATRAWSTDGLPGSERLAGWRRAASGLLGPVAVRAGGSAPLRLTVATARVDALQCSELHGGPYEVARTEPADGERLLVVLGAGPPARVGQGGREAVLTADRLALIDLAAPFTLACPPDGSLLWLTVPRALLGPSVYPLQRFVAAAVDGGVGVGAVAAAALRAVARRCGPLDEPAAGSLAAQLASLLALALRELRRPEPTLARARLLQQAIDAAERSLADPRLGPGTVAAEIGISTRYLHALFSAEGESFGRWLRARRIAQCHLDLHDPTRAHWTIAEIAAARGFSDASHFARAFRRQIGATPGQVRRRASGDPRSPAP